MIRQITLLAAVLLLTEIAFGQNWNQLGGSEQFPTSIYKDGNGTVYAGLSNDLLKSDNNGASWTSQYSEPKQNDFLPGPYDYFHYLGQRAVFTESGTMFIESRQSYIGDQQTMIFSNDRGVSHSVTVGTASVSQKGGTRFLGFYEKDPTTFIMSVSGSTDYYGTYTRHKLSTDGGQTWDDYVLKSPNTNVGRFDQIVGWIGEQLYTIPARNAFATPTALFVRNFPDTTLINTIPLPEATESKSSQTTLIQNNRVYHIYVLEDNPGQVKMSFLTPGSTSWSTQNFNFSFQNTDGNQAIFLKSNSLFVAEYGNYNDKLEPALWRKNLTDNAPFTQVNIDFPAGITSLSISGSNNDLFLNADEIIYQSENGGVSWSQFPSVGNGNTRAAELKFSGDEVWAFSGHRLSRKNSDLIWETLRPDFSGLFNGATIRKMEKLNGNYYLLLRNGGLYRWNGIGGGALQQVFAPATPDNFTYASGVNLTLSDGRLFYTGQDANRDLESFYSDNGTDWQPINSLISNPYKSGNRIFSTRQGGYFYSDDNGTSWTLSTANTPTELKKEPISGDLYFLFGDFDNMDYKLYRSSNNGTSWSITSYQPPAGEDLNPFGYWIGNVKYLLSGNDLVARFRNKTYKRKTGGSAWEEVNLPFKIAFDFYHAPDGDIYFSSIAEGNWSIAPSELFSSTPPPGDEEGLSLSAVANPENPGIWQFATATFTVRNNENYTFSDIRITVDAGTGVNGKGGDEFEVSKGTVDNFWTLHPVWDIDELLPGESAVLELNYFTLTSDPVSVWGQVWEANGSDPNSTPGNGTCCTPSEDDEAVVNFNGSGPPPVGDPDLSITGFTTIPQGAPGEVTTYTFDLNNTGAGSAVGDYTVGAYLSEFSSLNANSVWVGEINTGNTPVGSIANVPGAITIPPDMTPGFYYLILWADDGEIINEINETNNQVALPFQVIEVEGGQPDYYVPNVQPNTPIVDPGDNFVLENTYVNIGNVSAPRTTAKIYWSTDDVLSADDELYTTQTVFNMAPNQSQVRPTTIYVNQNMAPGTYYLIVEIDPDNEVSESDENNNIRASRSIQIGSMPNLPDLQILSANYSNIGIPGEVFTVTNYSIKNNGSVASGDFRVWMVLSEDQTPSLDDQVLSPGGALINWSSISGGVTVGRSFSNTFPNVPSGNYYIILEADANNSVIESNETNNQLISMITVTNPNDLPDFSLELVSAPASGTALTNYNVNYDLSKDGNDISQAFFNGLYISRDAVFDPADDIRIGTNQFLNGMIGNTQNIDITAGIPQWAPGHYTMFLVADILNNVPEQNETNNIVSFPFEILSSPSGDDLIVENLQIQNSPIQQGQDLNFTYDLRGGTGSGFMNNFETEIYISSDQTVDAGDVLVENFNTRSLNGGTTFHLRGPIRIPVPFTPGDYFLVIKTDANNVISESNESNNEIAVPFNVAPIVSGQIDLELSFAVTTPANPNQWSFYSEILTVRNTGTETATGVTVEFKVQPGATYKGGDEYTATQGDFTYFSNEIWTVGSIPSGESATLTVNYFLLNPAAPVAYAQVKSADQAETDSTPDNGTCCTPNEDDEASTNANPPELPDLQIDNLVALNSPMFPDNLQYRFDLVNFGNEGAFGSFEVRAFISTDADLSSDDFQGGANGAGNIPANTTSPNIAGATTLGTLTPGNYFLILKADNLEQITESNESNNLAAVPFTVLGNTGTDMTAHSLSVNSGSGFPDDQVSFNFFYENAGDLQPGINQIRYKVWLSSDTQLSNDDVQIADSPIPYPPPAGNSSSSAPLPQGLSPGAYYLILEIDSDNQITETNESNNTTVSVNQKIVLPPSGASCSFTTRYLPQGSDPLHEGPNNRFTELVDGYSIEFIHNSSDPQTPGTVTRMDLDLVGDVMFSLRASIPIHYDVTVEPTAGDTIEMIFHKSLDLPAGTRVPISLNYTDPTAVLARTRAVKISTGYAFGLGIVDQSLSPNILNFIIKTDNYGQNAEIFSLPNPDFYGGFNGLVEGIDGGIYTMWTTSGNFSVYGIPANGTAAWHYKVAGDTPSTRWISTKVSRDGQYVYTAKTDNLRAAISKLNASDGTLVRLNISDLENPNNTGNYRWTFVRGIQPVSDGGLLVSIGYDEPQTGAEGEIIGKIDAAGNLSWAREFSGLEFTLEPIDETSDGGALFVGIDRSDPSNIENVFIKTAADGALVPVCGDTGNHGVDLELSFVPLNSDPAQWAFFGTTLTITNTGTESATGVQIHFPHADEVVYKGGDEYYASQGEFQYWGNEIWTVGTLAPGETATLDVNYFRVAAGGFTAFAEISSLDQTDIDSSPGNGVCCITNEDDEAILSIGSGASNSVSNRNNLIKNLPRDEFAVLSAYPNPVFDEFTIQVFSKKELETDLMIFDVLGKPVLQQAIELKEGLNLIPVDINHLPGGFLSVKMTPWHPYLRQVRILKIKD